MKRAGGVATALVLFFAATAAAQDRAAPHAIADGPFVVAYWPGGERLARRVLAQARATDLPAIPTDSWTRERVTIAIAPDAARFRALAPGIPEWGAGAAIPSQGLIVLPGYDSQGTSTSGMPRVLRHELAHVALHRYVAPAYVPRWFNEGYARWAAGEWDLEAAWMLRFAFALRRAPPLDSLALDWPARNADARVAYLLSMSAVDYLADRGGERALGIFLQRWRENGDFERALRRTYGLTLSQLEEDWRKQVRRDYGWSLAFTNAFLFWSAAGVMVLVLFAIRRRRDARRLETLRENEVPDEPAYWEEEDERSDTL